MKRKSLSVEMKKVGKASAARHKENQQTKSHWSQIKPSPFHSEFEVQAYVYSELRCRGFNVRGEVSATTRSKFDLVVFSSEEKPLRIVEVKKLKKETVLKLAKDTAIGRQNLRSMENQVRKYLSYQIPVDLVLGMEDAIRYVKEFDIDSPSRLPQDLLEFKGWDGVVTPEDWLASHGGLEKACDDGQMHFAAACKLKGWAIRKICYRPDVGASYCMAHNSRGEAQCIVEFSHGIATEPEGLRQRRVCVGRQIAREHVMYLVRLEGSREVSRASKKMRDGRKPLFQGSHWTDHKTVKERSEILLAEKGKLSEEYKAIVAG